MDGYAVLNTALAEKVDTPATCSSSTSNCPSISTPPVLISTPALNVATPATTSSSKSVCPSTSKLPLISTAEPKVPPADTYMFPIESIPTPLPVKGYSPSCYLNSGLSVPTPTSADVESPDEFIVHAA